MLRGVGVREWDERPTRTVDTDVGVAAGEGNTATAPLHQRRADHDADEDESDDGVHDGGVEEADLESDERDGQRRRSLRNRESRHEPALVPVEPENARGEEGGPSLADQYQCDEHPDEHERVAADEHAHVDQHSDREEEEGDEERVTHESHSCHDRRLTRYEPVHREAGEEGADDRLRTRDLRRPGAHEHRHEEEDVTDRRFGVRS